MYTNNKTNSIALDLWSSGFVNRYHNHYDGRLRNSQDLTIAHSGRMLMLLIGLFPEYAKSSTMLLSVIMHDAPEYITGDSPHHAKRASGNLKRALDELELIKMKEFEERTGLFFDPHTTLTEKENLILKMLDQLESLLFQISVTPDRLNKEHPLIEGIAKMSLELDVSHSVYEIIINCAHKYGADKKDIKDVCDLYNKSVSSN